MSRKPQSTDKSRTASRNGTGRNRASSVNGIRSRTVSSAGIDLHVVEAGDPRKPGILFLHGFPDSHQVWDHQLRDLSADHHVIAFDLRGCGESGAPDRSSAFRIGQVLPDILAVINATRGPAGQVHLVGHDWGSVLGWSFVADPMSRGRVLSWTSMSGPHIGMMWQWLYRKLKTGRREEIRSALEQVAHSWYIFALHVPGLGGALFRFAGVEAWQFMLQKGGVPAGDPYLDATQDEVERNALKAIGLYRRNAFLPPRVPGPGAITIPVQLILPVHDIFIRPQIFEFMDEACTDLTCVPLDANHWAQRSHPEEFTGLVRGFIQRLSRKKTTAPRRPARRP